MQATSLTIILQHFVKFSCHFIIFLISEHQSTVGNVIKLIREISLISDETLPRDALCAKCVFASNYTFISMKTQTL